MVRNGKGVREGSRLVKEEEEEEGGREGLKQGDKEIIKERL